MSDKLTIPWEGKPPEDELQAFLAKALALYQRRLEQRAYSIVRNWDITEDIVHESFTKLYENIISDSSILNVGAWLGKVTVNAALMHVRRAKVMAGVHEALAYTGTEIIFDTAPETTECASVIKEIIKGFPPQQEHALRLRLFEELDFEQIAWRLECTESTARNHFSQAMGSLKSLLRERYPDGIPL